MEDDELFCGACGTKYVEPAPESPSAPVDAPSFCPGCGERLPEGTVFCPNCGMDVRTGQLSAGAKAGDGSAKRPISPRAIGIAAERYNEISSLSTDMTLTASCTSSNDMVDAMLEDSSVDLKVDLGGSSVLLDAGLTVTGSKVLSGSLSYDKGKVSFCLPEVDSNCYVADLTKMGDLLYLDDVEGLAELEIPKIPVSTLAKLGERYFDILASAATRDNVEKSDKKSRLEELGGSFEGQVYVFEPEAEDIEAMLEKLADQIEKDKDLRSFVTDLLGGDLKLLNEMEDLDIEGEVDEALNDLADELRDNARDIGRRVEDLELTWTLGLSKGKMVLNKIELRDGSQTIAFEADGEGRFVLYCTSYGEQEFMLEIEKDGKLQEGSVVGYYGGETFRVDYRDMDTGKTSILGIPYGDYDLSVDGGTVRMEVSGGKNGGTDHTLSLRDIYITYGFSADQLKVTLNTSDKKSTASKPKGKMVDISDYDSYELQELFYDIGSEISDAVGDLGMGYYWEEMAEQKLLCTLEDVEKRYDIGPAALGPVSLEVRAGEILGLRGPSGAGQSTLLQLLAGTLRPDRGTLARHMDGPVGYVPQDVALYPTLSGLDNLAFWGAVYGLPRKAIAARSRWLLERLELTGKAGARVSAYSGGMRRRLHLASALMVTPELLLLDEPTVGADPHSADLILSMLEGLRERGCGVVLVSHQYGELERVCGRILALEAGRIAAEDAP